MKKGRKIEKTSLAIMGQILEKGFMRLNDMVSIGYEYDKRFYYRSIYDRLYNLKRRGYVQVRKKGNESFFHLTHKGKLSVMKYLHLEHIFRKKWDKHWRIAIFDIPEDLKKWRNYIRKELKRLGFIPLQESVYITPYAVTGELNETLEDWGLREYFRYVTVTEIDGVKELKKQFDIK